MNNSENDNQGLNTISLGNMENSDDNLNVPISDIPPITPLEPIETLDSLDNDLSDNQIIEPESVVPVDEVAPAEPSTPIEEDLINNMQNDVFHSIGEVPPINNANNIPPVQPVEPIVPVNYDVPEPINSINTTPIFNEIGTIPPIKDGPVVDPVLSNEKDKKKNKMNKTIFVLIIVLALTAVAVSVYILLHMANVNKVVVNTKNIELEIGSSVSIDINDYATFKNIDSSSCSLDTTAVTDTSVLNAEYTYKVICGALSYTGNIKIVDTVKPEVTLKDVTVAVNGNVSADLFILECADSTECSYAFKEEAKVKEYLKSPESYRVAIVVKDEAGNETEVTGTLTVSNAVSSVYLICTKENITTRFGLVDSTFNKVATRVYTFTFATAEEYNSFKTENSGKSEVTYQNIKGVPEFNDQNYTLTLTKNITYDELNQEAGSNLPLTAGDLRTFYENTGYTCSIGF